MTVPVSMHQLSRHITLTVRVKGLRVFWIRWWLARHLLLFAAFVAGCGIEIEMIPTRDGERL